MFSTSMKHSRLWSITLFILHLRIFVLHFHLELLVLFVVSLSFLHYLYISDPSPLYDNNHYHEECLRCNSCGLNLTGPNQKRARRFKNQILCDLHFADVALMECSDFMQQLRSFKPQSLGCAVARRKSSTTLIFPLPPQACSGEWWKIFSVHCFPGSRKIYIYIYLCHKRSCFKTVF